MTITRIRRSPGSSHSTLLARCSWSFIVVFVTVLGCLLTTTTTAAQTLEAPFDNDYTLIDLGSVPELPVRYGGLTFLAGDPNTILIGGSANNTAGKLYSIGVIRDADNHITGFSGTATVFADAAYNDGGVAYGPGNVLFLARWPVNQIGQTKPDSTITDKIIDLNPFGVTPSPGGLNFVPPGFPGAGQLKIVTWSGGNWYTADLVPDGTGTFDITGVILETQIGGGPEGLVYVPFGSPQFPPFSVLVSEWSAGNVVVYELGANGDPIPATRTPFITGLTGAEGAAIDPLTGDFLFSTFAGDRVIAVQGFAPPPSSIVISPDRGGDIGSVSIRIFIYGGGVVEGTTVELVRVDEPKILGDPVKVGEGGFTVATTFDLTGKAQGLWDVVVTNPDGTILATLPEGFTIEEGRAAQVWVDILGRDVIRTGREQRHFILYGNRGNVDAVGVPLWITGFPSDAILNFGFEIEPLPLPDGELAEGLDQVPIALEFDGEVVIPLIIPVIPPDSAGALEIALTVPTFRDFQLRAWVNPPFFGSLLNVEVWECVSALAQAVAGFFPGGSCLSAVFEETSKHTGRIFITNDPENYSLGQVLFNLLTKCGGELIVTKKLQHVQKMIHAIVSGTGVAIECEEAFRAISDAELSVVTVQSVDPNDKVGSQGAGELQFLSGEEPLRYAIFFENVETATAPAQEVVITDQLDTLNMDLSTLSLGPITFGNKQVISPPGLSSFTTDVDLRPDNDLIVRITASLNQDSGVLTWRFTSIDPETGQPPEDPLAGFLPPNLNPPEGEGSVLFTVMPKEDIATGTEIYNSASIVFDTNEPIETPEWLNTIDNSKPDSQILPLAPTQTSTDFEVYWLGTDEGAGVRDYTILVSEDGGPYAEWLSNTPETSALFTGENGKTYAFYSMAQDQTGNLEDAPDVPDATTSVLANLPPVANAGSYEPFECTGPVGALVTLDGSASYDPDEDPLTYAWTWDGGSATGVSVTIELPLGISTITLVVNDGTVDSDPDTVTITVTDTTPPQITAALVPVGEIDDDEGLFKVEFSASDDCDENPSVSAVITCNGEEEAVTNGQIVEIESDDDECEFEYDDGILEVEGPSVELVVTATDYSGNVSEKRVSPSFAGDDNDDDDEDDDD